MENSIYEATKGFFAAGFVILSLILGIFIMLKYFKYKKSEFLFVGFTWIGIASLFWGYALNYLTYQFMGFEFNYHIYIFFATGTLAAVHITWMIPFTNMLYKKNQKKILIIVLIEAIIYEIIYILLYLTDINLIGTQISLYYVRWLPFVMFYVLATILLILITGITFAKKSLASNSKEIQLKGKFLMVAFISFTVGFFLEITFILPDALIILARIIIGSAAIEFYLGFVLPDRVKKLLLRED